MKTLEEIQSEFCHSIIHGKTDSHDFISSDNALGRLAIYKNTILDTLRKSLQITFPGIWVLVGDECANNLALAFCKIIGNLPVSGCLDDWGNEFPEFISRQESLKKLPYLKDYGDYEWLKHLSYSSAQAVPLGIEVMNTISEDQVERMSFIFHPSVYMMQSEYALDEIAALIENPDFVELNSISKKTFCVILRSDSNVMSYWLAEDLWNFISHLLKGLSLGVVCQTMIQHYPQFDFSKALHFIFQKRMITSFSIYDD